MGKDNQGDQLRDAIASKLQEKAKSERSTGAPRPTVAGPPADATIPPTSVMETARQILQTRIAIGGPKLQDLAHMCRQLATLIDVGIPVARALKIMGDRTRHPKLRQAMTDVHAGVESGQTISSSLERHPKIIPPMIANIVRIGETGGILENALARLAEIYEAKADIKRKVLSAVAYPVVALLVAAAVLVIIFVKVIPVFQDVYEQKEGVELPNLTQNVINVSEFLRGYYLLYVPVLIGACVLLWWFGTTPRGRRVYDLLLLKLPVVGPLNTKINVARFTRTLSNLISAGIPMLDALTATANSSDNVIMAESLNHTRDHVEQGGKMEDVFRRSHAIPPIVTDMVAIGDEAGTLDTMLDRMADAYESEVDAALKGLVALIEPILIIFLGIVVIIIALAVLLPYWSIGDVIE
jgi:type IV pilus assembly protein PilC